MKRQFSWWVALLLALGLVSRAFAQETPKAAPEAAGPALMDRAATLAFAAEVTQAKYPDADDVLADQLVFVHYEADGTSVTFGKKWTKVLTDKGRRDNEHMSVHFNEAYSKVAFDLLEVIKPDGKATPVDIPTQSRVTNERILMGWNTYDPHYKVLEIGIPGLAVGDIVHYHAIRTTFKAPVPKTWSDWTVLEGTSPIRHVLYEVSGPKELPLRSIALKDEVPGTVSFAQSEQDGRLIYHWEARDVPRMYEEPQMPPACICVQRLLVSTGADWRDISRWYWTLSLRHGGDADVADRWPRRHARPAGVRAGGE
jgi:hypothetical protein